MKALLLVGLLAAPAAAAKAKAAKGSASADDKKLVDYFIKTPTGDLNPSLIPRFMALDLSKLDPKRRDAAGAKRDELDALRRIAEGKTKPPIRRAGKKPIVTCGFETGSRRKLDMLESVGFTPITEDEENFLEKKTKCSMCELTQEFTLTRYVIPAQKAAKRPEERYYLLNGSDPLMALVGQYRRGAHGGTDFFGVGFFGACR
ncbi:MAG: hypothetical protein KGL53_04085 [Elusimicrobia bacterium]|nr:hypothetical protein [Elusimicrobiota bacterium]